MAKINCVVKETDAFSRELLEEFINKTEGLLLSNDLETNSVIFIDPDQGEAEMVFSEKDNTQVVVVSANRNYVIPYFEYQITDFLFKPDLNYQRFLDTAKKIKAKA